MGCVKLYLGGSKTYALGLGTMRDSAYKNNPFGPKSFLSTLITGGQNVVPM